jgi:hypothetical protein
VALLIKLKTAPLAEAVTGELEFPLKALANAVANEEAVLVPP